jgi:hypothetical protein
MCRVWQLENVQLGRWGMMCRSAFTWTGLTAGANLQLAAICCFVSPLCCAAQHLCHHDTGSQSRLLCVLLLANQGALSRGATRAALRTPLVSSSSSRPLAPPIWECRMYFFHL